MRSSIVIGTHKIAETFVIMQTKQYFSFVVVLFGNIPHICNIHGLIHAKYKNEIYRKTTTWG